jgi:hypothetical protein
MITKKLMYVFAAYAVLAGVISAQDGCLNGSPICLGCPSNPQCTTCHGGDNGNFWMAQIPDQNGRPSGNWICGCDCRGGIAAVQTKVDLAHIPQNVPKWTELGRRVLEGFSKGPLGAVFSVFDPPKISQKGEFMRIHAAAAENLDTSCGRNTMNRVMAYVDKLK